MNNDGTLVALKARPSIMLIGKAGAGKTTVAQYLRDRYGYRAYALATRIKEIAHELFLDGPPEGKPRELYQKVGDQMRAIDPHCWIRALRKRIAEDRKTWSGPMVIDDVRYPKEVVAFQDEFVPVLIETAYDVRLERLRQRDGHVDEAVLGHGSERGVDEIKAMFQVYTLSNNGSIEELYQSVNELLKGLPNLKKEDLQ